MGRCVIFDLDGTLADTSGDLIAAANYCFSEMGRAVRLDPLADAGIALRGGRRMLTEGLRREDALTEAEVDLWYPVLLRAYGDAIDTHTRLYPGAVDAVAALRTGGYCVGICTNKPAALAETLLQRLGVRDLFGSMIGADTLPVRKPEVAPYWAAVEGCGGVRERSLLVGDSDTDRKTAAAAGRPCILVTFAPDGHGVLSLEPEGSIDHFDGLGAEVLRLIG